MDRIPSNPSSNLSGRISGSESSDSIVDSSQEEKPVKKNAKAATRPPRVTETPTSNNEVAFVLGDPSKKGRLDARSVILLGLTCRQAFRQAKVTVNGNKQFQSLVPDLLQEIRADEAIKAVKAAVEEKDVLESEILAREVARQEEITGQKAACMAKVRAFRSGIDVPRGKTPGKGAFASLGSVNGLTELELPVFSADEARLAKRLRFPPYWTTGASIVATVSRACDWESLDITFSGLTPGQLKDKVSKVLKPLATRPEGKITLRFDTCRLNAADGAAFLKLCAGNDSLAELHLTGITFLPGALGSFVAVMSAGSLEKICMNDFDISEERQFLPMLLANQSLRTLELTSGTLGNNVAENLYPYLMVNESLTRLSINGVLLDHGHAVVLAQALESNCNLKELELEKTGLSQNHCKKLIKSLRRNRNLTTLRIIGTQTPSDQHAISALLKTNTTLEKLDLSGARFTGASLAEILVSLEQNSTLRELNLRAENLFQSSRMTPEDVNRVACMIENNFSLRILNLTNISFTQADLIRLDKAVTKRLYPLRIIGLVIDRINHSDSDSDSDASNDSETASSNAWQNGPDFLTSTSASNSA
jgi:hypothetical protein